MNSFFEQRDSGFFMVEVEGANHCGPNHRSPKRFRYDIQIVYKHDSLDDNGFLLDNLTFKQYFRSIGRTALSCELLARKTAEDFTGQLQGRPWYRCVVSLWGGRNIAMVRYVVFNREARRATQ